MSFYGQTAARRSECAIERSLRGLPVGPALRDMHDRGIQLGATLLEDLNDMDFSGIISPVVIGGKWKERNNARARILIGESAAGIRSGEIK